MNTRCGLESRRISLLLSGLFAAFSAHAVLLTVPHTRSACDRDDVREISRPVYPDRADSPRFPYKYQYARASDASQPVIVYMPGGPGGGSISHAWDYMIPEGYGVVLTDQRGANCNDRREQNFPRDGYTTRYLAEDVVEIIRREKLSRYIIYGHSYGTMHATMVASIIEARRRAGEDIAAPEAVVLEGVIGRAFGPGEAYGYFRDEWERLKARATDAARERLLRDETPFADIEDASGRWGSAIQQGLYAGRLPRGEDFARLLNTLGGGEESRLRQSIQFSDTGAYGYGELFEIIGCREIFADFPHRMILSRGKLVAEGSSCRGVDELVDPYDSRAWPIEAPTYYFAGTLDPATPLSHAEYAFESSVAATKRLIAVHEAGHSPLMQSFRSAGCRAKVWESLRDGGRNLQQALWDCHWPWSVTLSEERRASSARRGFCVLRGAFRSDPFD